MKKRVLIVEDDAIASLYIQEMLEIHHQVTGTVDTGEEAVTRAANDHPDLILMDIMLKGKITGIEAVKIIKKSHDIPVIYCTAYNDDATIAEANGTCPAGILAKPVNPVELNRIIDSIT
jgi:CheY-like chemotaxis protein